MSGQEEGKGLSEIGIEATAGMSGIMEAQAGKKREENIVDGGKVASGMRMGHAGGILMKSDIAAIVQPVSICQYLRFRARRQAAFALVRGRLVRP